MKGYKKSSTNLNQLTNYLAFLIEAISGRGRVLNAPLSFRGDTTIFVTLTKLKANTCK